MIQVWYHKNCSDGNCCAWILKDKFPSAKFTPLGYKDEVPKYNEDDIIYCVDFCFSKEVMKKIHREIARLLVIDHHKSVDEELREQPWFVYDNDHSAAWLVWKYFKEKVPVHWLVEYTQDRDLWQWKLPYSKEVSATIYSYDLKDWKMLAQLDPTASVKSEGMAIIRAQEKIIKNIYKNKHYIYITNQEIAAINSACFQSELGNMLAEEYSIGCVYFRIDGDHIVYSLRSIGDIDVSEIAKLKGGGGHKNAAGFIVRSSTSRHK